MKKLMKKFVLGFVVAFMMTTGVNAQSYSLEIDGPTTASRGSELKLTIRIKDPVNIGGSSNGISVLMADLTFDETVLERTNMSGLNGFNATVGSRIVLDSTQGVSISRDIGTITFKVKDEAVLANTNITFSNITGSNGDTNISTADVVKTVSITNTGGNMGDSPGGNPSTFINNPYVLFIFMVVGLGLGYKFLNKHRILNTNL